MRRRTFLIVSATAIVGAGVFCGSHTAADNPPRTVRVALVQFDAVPEQPERNRDAMDRLARAAASKTDKPFGLLVTESKNLMWSGLVPVGI